VVTERSEFHNLRFSWLIQLKTPSVTVEFFSFFTFGTVIVNHLKKITKSYNHMKTLIAFTLLLTTTVSTAQQKAFDTNEWLQFRIHYGWFNASEATLEVKEDTYKGTPVHHIVGKGKSTGLLHLFFEVDDNYETYVDKTNGQPYKFIRKINEGGHTKDIEINFDHSKNSALVHNKKYNTKKTFTTKEKVHDMLSAFYYLRNNLDPTTLTSGEEQTLNLFFDEENFKFKLKFLERETIKTKFGKIKCLKFRPYVQAGRVFKEEESLTFWVSDDPNMLPIKIEADLAVGSLEADLSAFKGLKHPFQIVVN
jgi:hypothetical protein